MIIKKNYNIISVLLGASLLLSSPFAIAADELVGTWKGAGISLKIDANKQYQYKMKLLNVGGKWSATKDKLTLNYSILGIAKVKKSSFSLKGNKLTLKRKDKESITLTKQN
ncbi:MAG: hypothetical protein KAH22_04730 [Thiotrichaceae bacterium]|nr:hypothetical protein [Thiotrichaceae bacterium]